MGQLQVAEEELLGLQVRYEEMESELTKSAGQLRKASALLKKSEQMGNERVAELEHKLKRRTAILRKADKKIEMLEQSIEHQKQATNTQSSSREG